MKKNTVYTMITLTTFFITKSVFKSVGIENVYPIAFALFTIGAYILFLVSTLRNREKGMGKKYNITVCILMGLICFSTTLGITVIKCYPELFVKYGLFLLILFFTSFISLAIYCVVARIKYENND